MTHAITHNVATGEIVVREANATELANLAQLAAEVIAITDAQTARNAQRQILLDRLGITADEVKLLLG